jgi:hypothetical protein
MRKARNFEYWASPSPETLATDGRLLFASLPMGNRGPPGRDPAVEPSSWALQGSGPLRYVYVDR